MQLSLLPKLISKQQIRLKYLFNSMSKHTVQILSHVILLLILDAEEKPIVWSNTIKIPLANDQSIDIKLYNDKVLLAKDIFNVPSTLDEQKNTLELLS